VEAIGLIRLARCEYSHTHPALLDRLRVEVGLARPLVRSRVLTLRLLLRDPERAPERCPLPDWLLAPDDIMFESVTPRTHTSN